MIENPFPLNILPKEDTFDKVRLLQHLDPSLKLSADEINKILLGLDYLAENVPAVALDSLLGVNLLRTSLDVDSNLEYSGNDGLVIGRDATFNIAEGKKVTFSSKLNRFTNHQIFFGEGEVRFNPGAADAVHVGSFGAKTISNSDFAALTEGEQNELKKKNAIAIQKAIDTAIFSKGLLRVLFDAGRYYIDRSLICIAPGGFFGLELIGMGKPYINSTGGATEIYCDDSSVPFILGLQGTRGVVIENLIVKGWYEARSPSDLIYKSLNELRPFKRYAPESAIVIDPFSSSVPPDGGYIGITAQKDSQGEFRTLSSYYNVEDSRASSEIVIDRSTMVNMPVLVALSPNGETQQGDSICISNSVLGNGNIGIVTCQDQARTVSVFNNNMGRVKYGFDTKTYGDQKGIMPEVLVLKLSDRPAWLFNHNGVPSFAHFSHVYMEGAYGIGYAADNRQAISIVSSVLKLAPSSDADKLYLNPCVLKADYVNMTGCTVTVGGGGSHREPLIIDVKHFNFDGGNTSTPFFNVGENSLKPNFKKDHIINLVSNPAAVNTNWSQEKVFDHYGRTIEYEGGDLYRVGLVSSEVPKYTVNEDFLFGRVELDIEPFAGDVIFTALGLITDITGTILQISSKVLPKEDRSIRINVKYDEDLMLPKKRQTRSFEIKGWNMDVAETFSYPHFLTSAEWPSVLVNGIAVVNDDGTISRDLFESGGYTGTDTDNMNFYRVASGDFDNASYNDTSAVRIYAEISFIPE